MTPASTLPTFTVFPGDRGPPIVQVYNRAWAGAPRLHHGPRHHHPSAPPPSRASVWTRQVHPRLKGLPSTQPCSPNNQASSDPRRTPFTEITHILKAGQDPVA